MAGSFGASGRTQQDQYGNLAIYSRVKTANFFSTVASAAEKVSLLSSAHISATVLLQEIQQCTMMQQWTKCKECD
jgi:hypothetical protein